MRLRTFLLLFLSFMVFTNISVLLNLPVLRVVLGSIFLTVLPGLLITFSLKLDEIAPLPKILLSLGLSYAFLMFYGLAVNSIALAVNYMTPLATTPLLISLDAAIAVLGAIAYLRNREAFLFSAFRLRLDTREKVVFITALVFPLLSIFGTHLMNNSGNNIVLMVMLLLIPVYVITIVVLNRKLPARVYPFTIFMVGVALLLMFSLRSSSIIGTDVHWEFSFFQATVDNAHWSILKNDPLDACLSISLLPAIYQSILNMDQTIFFKLFYSMVFSITPLAVYIISRKYVSEIFAFLASLAFLSDRVFIWTAANARTTTAIMFFVMAIMTLLTDRISRMNKRILFVVFVASVVVSHYSTASAFFLMGVIGWLLATALARKFTFSKGMTFNFLFLFGCLIFLWYSQVTEGAFTSVVGFFEETIRTLRDIFIAESRGGAVPEVLGAGFAGQEIVRKIHIITAWLVVAGIGLGALSIIRNFRRTVLTSKTTGLKSETLKGKMDVDYFVLVLACCALMVFVVIVPQFSRGFGTERFFTLAMVILSLIFVVGCRSLAGTLSRLRLSKRYLLGGRQLNASIIILLVWVLYFMAGTGTLYQLSGIPQEITINSEGTTYNAYYIHRQETQSAAWLTNHTVGADEVYAEPEVKLLFRDVMAPTAPLLFRTPELSGLDEVSSYIYLRYHNVVDGQWFFDVNLAPLDFGEYEGSLDSRDKLYDNGGSAIYR
jgi:uncharacterized membrane protein